MNQVLQLGANLFVRPVLVNHNVCSLAELCFAASRIVVVPAHSSILLLIQTVKDPLIELLVILRLFIWGLATLSRAIDCHRGIGHSLLLGFDARG